MLRIFFFITIRNFWKQKFYSSINIFGFSVGLTTVILILLYVTHELSFDRFHIKSARLARVVENQYYSGQPVFPVAVTPIPLGPSLVEDYAEINQFARLMNTDLLFEKEGEKYPESGIYVDPAFLNMFSFPLLYGEKETALASLENIIIDEELTKKYFGDENPVGKTIIVDGEEKVVSAVMKNFPKNTHIQANFIRSFESSALSQAQMQNWRSNTLFTFIEVNQGVEVEELSQKISGQIKKFNTNSITEIYLQPITDIHLGEVQFVAEMGNKGNAVYVNMFILIAVIILLIACINFMNLSTAKSVNRAKEVGLRKTLGAHRSHLIYQFMGESVFMTLLAMIIAIFLADLALPFFNTLANTDLSINSISSATGTPLLVWGISLTLLTGIIAGSYPAFFLSRFNPAYVLKGSFKGKREGSILRKVLVTIQFGISILLVIGTLVVLDQLNFMKTMRLGINKENVIYVPQISNNNDVFKDQIMSLTSVKGIGFSNQHPAYVENSSSGFVWPGKDPDQVALFHLQSVDGGYIEAMGLELAEGRNFNKHLPGDTASIIINEVAAKIMNMENPVGQKLTEPFDITIIGVVKDFHFKSAHSRIEPLIMFTGRNNYNRTFIKIDGNNVSESVSQVKAVWNKLNQEQAMPYRFLDEDYEKLYQSEERTSKIFTNFTLLAFLISGLGLFGLSSFTAEQRLKEISIRKVMGATSLKLFWLVSTDLTRLSIISILIAVPVGWYWMNSWLEGFAYRIEISPVIFIVASLVGIIITFLTVSFQSLKVSASNPVNHLRNE